MRYTPDQIARVAHEANRGLQAVHGSPGIPVSPPWDEETEEIRGSVISGVMGVLGGATPEESHEAWCAYKRADGWVHGQVKDEQAKTHPCLVDFADLPTVRQDKDVLFAAIVHALAGGAS